MRISVAGHQEILDRTATLAVVILSEGVEGSAVVFI
jgi:hypothetical protein